MTWQQSIAHAQDHDELCLEAVDLMLKILGAEAGHMGIRLLASGGVFLTGAVTAVIVCCTCKCGPCSSVGNWAMPTLS